MIGKKKWAGIVILIFTMMLTGCSSGKEETSQENNEEDTQTQSSSESHMDMNHSSSGEVPEELKDAESPTYEVGSQVIIETGHMKGMKGAEATIEGAYNTTAYVVSYTPTTGGERVEDHKWVIHEEIKEPGEEPLEPGTEVTIQASHMKGMKGATAEIESAKQTTVYMVSYTPTTGGEKVTNHKWVTASELSAA
ncbi:YdhK family protein [Halobacillus naozhouensis]|uniref:YdhK family protein n=1 Tax=Halobacillus naozhouensis TaxID=554880 RepID=A0ABY8IZ20_9BACI|nr:YdhK family protein [Halobacillus naozhouensis]WFT75465.1 YdhK family protein [Halobacillus naozhouensis]